MLLTCECPPGYLSQDLARTSRRQWLTSLVDCRYSSEFANKFVSYVASQCESADQRLAFLCCPTSFVAFRHAFPSRPAKLLEFDKRFGLVDKRNYIFYDLDDPEAIPDELAGSIDLAICDPPFLNEVSVMSHDSVVVSRRLLNVFHALAENQSQGGADAAQDPQAWWADDDPHLDVGAGSFAHRLYRSYRPSLSLQDARRARWRASERLRPLAELEHSRDGG